MYKELLKTLYRAEAMLPTWSTDPMPIGVYSVHDTHLLFHDTKAPRPVHKFADNKLNTIYKEKLHRQRHSASKPDHKCVNLILEVQWH